MLGVTLRWTSIPSKGQGGVEILLVASCYRNRDDHWPDGPPGSYAGVEYSYYEKEKYTAGLRVFFTAAYLSYH